MCLSLCARRLLDFQRGLRRQGIEVDKAQKGELRISEDTVLELKRRIELQVRGSR